MRNYDHVEDSGERQEFSTGAVRDTQTGKGRYDLLLSLPHTLYRLARHFENGAVKYGDDNWKKGLPLRRFLDSAFRHVCKFAAGEDGEDHLIAAIWNLSCLCETQHDIETGRMDPSLDDLPKYAQRPDWETEDGRGVVLPMNDAGERKTWRCPHCNTVVWLRGDENSLDTCPACNWTRPLEKTDLEVFCPFISATMDNMKVPVDKEPMRRPCCGTPCPQTEQWVMYKCPQCGWTPIDSAKLGATLNRTKSDCAPTFYVAGPMRGYKDLNFKAFDEAAERGRKLGYTIISPADLDREHGIDPGKDPTVAEHENHLSASDLHRIIRRDVEAIMSLQPDQENGIAVLQGWRGSIGASAEVALARWLGLKVVQVSDFRTPAIGGQD